MPVFIGWFYSVPYHMTKYGHFCHGSEYKIFENNCELLQQVVLWYWLTKGGCRATLCRWVNKSMNVVYGRMGGLGVVVLREGEVLMKILTNRLDTSSQSQLTPCPTCPDGHWSLAGHIFPEDMKYTYTKGHNLVQGLGHWSWLDTYFLKTWNTLQDIGNGMVTD